MRPILDPWHRQSLYLAHLARRLEALEAERVPHAVACRLFARRLQSALAGLPVATAVALGQRLPCVLHALSQRHFEEHGVFAGAAGEFARLQAARLFDKLGCKPAR